MPVNVSSSAFACNSPQATLLLCFTKTNTNTNTNTKRKIEGKTPHATLAPSPLFHKDKDKQTHKTQNSPQASSSFSSTSKKQRQTHKAQKGKGKLRRPLWLPICPSCCKSFCSEEMQFQGSIAQ